MCQWSGGEYSKCIISTSADSHAVSLAAHCHPPLRSASGIHFLTLYVISTPLWPEFWNLVMAHNLLFRQVTLWKI